MRATRNGGLDTANYESKSLRYSGAIDGWKDLRATRNGGAGKGNRNRKTPATVGKTRRKAPDMKT